jgi:hypothetical protein
VQVDEVVLPMFEPAFHRIPLQTLGQPPFIILVSKSLLMSRNKIPPIISPSSISDSNARNVPENLSTYPPPEILLPSESESHAEFDIESSDVEDDNGDTEPSDGVEDQILMVTREIDEMDVC